WLWFGLMPMEILLCRFCSLLLGPAVRGPAAENEEQERFPSDLLIFPLALTESVIRSLFPTHFGYSPARNAERDDISSGHRAGERGDRRPRLGGARRGGRAAAARGRRGPG